MWPEVEIVKNENKREIKLQGAAISEKIDKHGLDICLFELSNLNLLNISDTTLKILPANISNLTNLQSILLFGNELEELPSSLGQLTKLKILDVSRNKLKYVPNEIVQLPNLTAINFSENQLSSFPSITACTKLGSLDLSHNKIEDFSNICVESLSNLSEINFKGNLITCIPNEIAKFSSLKQLNLSENKITTIPKVLSTVSKLKDLDLGNNPIADKRLMKLIQQCRTKQILDYVKEHGTESTNGTDLSADKQSKKSSRTATKAENHPLNKIIIKRHTDESLRVIYMDIVKDIRPFILCCIVRHVDLNGNNFKKFLQIQTKLHESICGKREQSTIATHDLDKLKPGSFVKFTAREPTELEIIPLGKSKKISAQKLYDDLKAEAEALRKAKKRNVYSGIHKYLYLLEKKNCLACLEDSEGNIISLPPLTNSEVTKISPDSINLLIEVTSSTSLEDCRRTIQELLREMLMSGFGILNVTDEIEVKDNVLNQLIIQQIKVTDVDGNLRNVYPAKNDLQFDENLNVTIERE